jgi:hypothetical protein
MLVQSPFFKKIQIQICDSVLINNLISDSNLILDKLTDFQKEVDLGQLFTKIKESNDKVKTRFKPDQYYQIIGSGLMINFRLTTQKGTTYIESVTYYSKEEDLKIKIRNRKSPLNQTTKILSITRMEGHRTKDLILGIDYEKNVVSDRHTAVPDPKLFKFMVKNYSHWPIIDEHDIVHAKMSI